MDSVRVRGKGDAFGESITTDNKIPFWKIGAVDGCGDDRERH